jgi:hypothetical protein
MAVIGLSAPSVRRATGVQSLPPSVLTWRPSATSTSQRTFPFPLTRGKRGSPRRSPPGAPLRWPPQSAPNVARRRRCGRGGPCLRPCHSRARSTTSMPRTEMSPCSTGRHPGPAAEQARGGRAGRGERPQAVPGERDCGGLARRLQRRRARRRSPAPRRGTGPATPRRPRRGRPPRWPRHGRRRTTSRTAPGARCRPSRRCGRGPHGPAPVRQLRPVDSLRNPTYRS